MNVANRAGCKRAEPGRGHNGRLIEGPLMSAFHARACGTRAARRRRVSIGDSSGGPDRPGVNRVRLRRDRANPPPERIASESRARPFNSIQRRRGARRARTDTSRK